MRVTLKVSSAGSSRSDSWWPVYAGLRPERNPFISVMRAVVPGEELGGRDRTLLLRAVRVPSGLDTKGSLRSSIGFTGKLALVELLIHSLIYSIKSWAPSLC